MMRSLAIGCLWAVLGFGARAIAQETAPLQGTLLEGRVALPAVKRSAPGSARYQGGGITGKVGVPEAPRAVVYLEGPGCQIPADLLSKPFRLEQREYQFVPTLLAVPRGARVEFPNADDDYHSVFSYSKARKFDLGRYRKEEAPPVITFDQAGVVRLNCEIHAHMRGTVLVLETPFFTSTDTNGHYQLRIPVLPQGGYSLKAWVDEKDVRTKDLTLQPGSRVQVDFDRP